MDKLTGSQPSTPVRVSRKDLRELRYVDGKTVMDIKPDQKRMRVDER